MKYSSSKYRFDKTGLILIFSVISIFYSCKQTCTEEKYDIISTTYYKNKYDDAGRLSLVEMTENHYSKVHGIYVLNIINTVQKYKWSEDGTHEIRKTTDLSLQEYEIIRIGENSKEYYTIRDGTDTIDYLLQRYYDKEMLKPEYIRRINRHVGLLEEYDRNDNYEEHYYYDESGYNNKTIKRDFNSGEVVEEYSFKGISYDEAVKQVPESNNRQEIRLSFEEMSGDTLITRIFRENKLFYLTKKYESNGKAIEISVDSSDRIDDITVEYKAGNVDIWVRESPQLGHVDSIYTINGKEVRTVGISPYGESIEFSEYDEKGNLMKKVYKSINRMSLTDSEFEEMVKRVREMKKADSVVMERDSSVNRRLK